MSLPLQSLAKSVRLEFPRFRGDDPATWVYKANQYFNFYHTPLSERLLMASFHMDGEALVWFQDCEASGEFVAWESFVEALLIKFGSFAYEDPMEALTRLRQTSNVINYKAQFEALSNRIRDLSENHKLSCFLSGLRDEIRLPVKMLNPKTLNEAFGLAKIQEEYVMSSKKFLKSSSLEMTKPSVLGPRPDTKLDSKFKLPLQKLSPAQMEERRKKGLYFNCDEKFQPGHHCKSAKLFSLEGLCPFQGPSSSVQLVELNEGDSALAYNSDVPHLAFVESEHNMLEPKITLYALLGSPSPSTMRIRGTINGHWVIILIDTGSTYDFLDAAILSKLQLQLDPTVSFEVKVANGETIKTKGVCVDVKVVMQGHIFSMDLNVLPLGDCKLVLGTQWLKSLGLI